MGETEGVMRAGAFAVLVGLASGAAAAQTVSEPAPELALVQQPIGKWSGPSFWIRPDLLLLGRADRVNDNSKLWYWSKAQGVFVVELPAALAKEDRPNWETLCTQNGVLQWLGPETLARDKKAPDREVFQLSVDPATKASRLDRKRAEIIRVFEGRLQSTSIAENASKTGSYYIVETDRKGCRLVSQKAALKAVEKGPELVGTKYFELYSVANGDHVLVTHQARNADILDTYLVVSPDFKPRKPQPADPESLLGPPQLPKTPFGSLRVVDLTNYSEPQHRQVQLTLPSGAMRALATSPIGFSVAADGSLDGCLLQISGGFTTRLTLPGGLRPEVRPPPPGYKPPKPEGLGFIYAGVDMSIIDLCSPENRALLEKAN